MTSRALRKLALRPLLSGVVILTGLGLASTVTNGRDSAGLSAQDLLLVLVGGALASNVRNLRTPRFAGYLRTLPLGRAHELGGVHALAGAVALVCGAAFYLTDRFGLATRAFNGLAPLLEMSELPVGERPWVGVHVLVYPWASFWVGVATQVTRRALRHGVLEDVSAFAVAALLFLGPQVIRQTLDLGGWDDPRFGAWSAGTCITYAVVGGVAARMASARLARTPIGELPGQEARP